MHDNCSHAAVAERLPCTRGHQRQDWSDCGRFCWPQCPSPCHRCLVSRLRIRLETGADHHHCPRRPCRHRSPSAASRGVAHHDAICCCCGLARLGSSYLRCCPAPGMGQLTLRSLYELYSSNQLVCCYRALLSVPGNVIYYHLVIREAVYVAAGGGSSN